MEKNEGFNENYCIPVKRKLSSTDGENNSTKKQKCTLADCEHSQQIHPTVVLNAEMYGLRENIENNEGCNENYWISLKRKISSTDGEDNLINRQNFTLADVENTQQMRSTVVLNGKMYGLREKLPNKIHVGGAGSEGALWTVLYRRWAHAHEMNWNDLENRNEDQVAHEFEDPYTMDTS